MKTLLAPIVLFVYNRPWHTKETLEALKKNLYAEQSNLFIFSDGSKNEKGKRDVEKVRDYIKKIKGFKSLDVVEREKNLGLANSVISGATEVINKYKKVIVLEDDLISSPFFLRFMNEALNFYKDDKKIFTISGFLPPIKVPKNYPYDVFVEYRASSTGWATWEDRWDKVDWNVKDYNEFIKNKDAIRKFNRSGSNFSRILRDQMNGVIDSWAIRRLYAQFKNNSFCVFPVESLIKNIGFDGSGVHSGKNKKHIEMEIGKKKEFILVRNLKVDKKINARMRKLNSTGVISRVYKRLKSKLKRFHIK